MRLSKAEMETVILFDEAGSAATIYTHNEKLKAQLAEYMAQYPDNVGNKHMDDHGALHCSVPKQDLRISLKKPRSEKQMLVARKNGDRFRESCKVSTRS